MSLSSPPRFPSSFDPAIHLHSEQDRHRDAPLLTSSHSDEFEALRQQLSESTAAKNKQGIVIQHRAWKVPEAFRSEEDHAVGELALHNMARAGKLEGAWLTAVIRHAIEASCSTASRACR